MGLKRRAAGRKQVLDLTEKQESPRRSWQTKYQQICVEHNTKNGDSPEPDSAVVSSSSKIATNNPLSGLLANYHSDSEGDDEERDPARDLDAKVSDFLKEIQTMVPSGSSIVVPGQPMTTPGVLESQPAAAVSAWQECFDETTGYIYYWHTETNDVTWETPAEYLPQITSSNQNEVPVVTSNASSMVPNSVSTTHQREFHHLTQDVGHWQLPSQPVHFSTITQSVSAPVAGSKEPRPVAAYHPKSTDKASSDSEEEKIEMITSFGETSEEESEEEIKPPTKKKKLNQDRTQPLKSQPSSTTAEELIGPRLPSPANLQTLMMESEVDEGSNVLLNQVDDVGPPGVELDTRCAVNSTESLVVVSQAMESIAYTSEPELGTEASPQGSEGAVAQSWSSVATPLGSDGGESGDTEEGVILSRIRTQAQVLQELGGELPAEVRKLMEPTTEERPSELPDFEKEMEQMEEELKQLASTATQSLSTESSPKTLSFALIAGYGDDSDQEEEVEKHPTVEMLVVQKRTFESLPTVPVKSLFPIVDYSVPQLEQKRRVIAKSGTNIIDPDEDVTPTISHSILFPTVTSTTEVPLPALRLQDSNLVTTEKDDSVSATPEPIIDSTLPTKAAKRKKRLDISTSAELVAASKLPDEACANSSLPEGERKGFGFGKLDLDADSFLLNCMTEFESTQLPQKVVPVKDKGLISFVKGDVLLGPEAAEEAQEDTHAAIETEKGSDTEGWMEEEACKAVDSLAQLVLEKVAFLGEGREPTSPVQVMAIQIETLVSAWHAHALSRAYLSKWLGETGDELRRLETAAAPEGWACQWDRSHKRYYYYNILSGETQWEYPTSPEEGEEVEENCPLQEQQPPPETPVAEDIAGGEQAMEICTTPPPSPSPTPAASPHPHPQTPPPPPPPTISDSRELSPPPPPRISPFRTSENKEPRRHKGKGRRRRLPASTAEQPGGNKYEKGSPIPPPPDINPPLPPLPPPPSSPPPPPPAELPPLPATSPRQQLAYGEPLPPGVDPGELPYMPRPVSPPTYQTLDSSPPPAIDVGQIHVMHQHAMQTTYVMASYQPAMVQPSLTTSIQGGAPVIDYGGMSSYLMHTHVAVPAIIAKPPAKKHKAALHAALDSFYSDLAIMGPAHEGMSEATAMAAPVPASAEKSTGNSEQSTEPDSLATKQADQAAKKKKVKKVVGLSLKKRGVSSLVAKWQQVQQEVRRDFETLDQDDDSSFQ